MARTAIEVARMLVLGVENTSLISGEFAFRKATAPAGCVAVRRRGANGSALTVGAADVKHLVGTAMNLNQGLRSQRQIWSTGFSNGFVALALLQCLIAHVLRLLSAPTAGALQPRETPAERVPVGGHRWADACGYDFE